jgi:hypothetical protein
VIGRSGELGEISIFYSNLFRFNKSECPEGRVLTLFHQVESGSVMLVPMQMKE